MHVRVLPTVLQAAADDMSTTAGSIDEIGARAGDLTGAAHPEVVAALESYAIAWQAALEVVADDVGYVAGRASTAVDEFVRLDGDLAAIGDVAEDPNAIQPE